MPQMNRLHLPEPETEIEPDHSNDAPKVYAAFYKFCGALARSGERGRPIVDGRVLQRDFPLDRSTHLFVLQSHRALTSQRVYNEARHPYQRYQYLSPDFTVLTTDGVAIQQWDIDSVYGLHSGHPNGVDRPYDPSLEELYFDLESAQQTQAHLKLNRITGGALYLADGLPLWILDAQTSAKERKDALAARTRSLGQTGLAA